MNLELALLRILVALAIVGAVLLATDRDAGGAPPPAPPASALSS